MLPSRCGLVEEQIRYTRRSRVTRDELAASSTRSRRPRSSKLAGDDVQIVFDGAGTKWPGELAKPDHKVHALYASVRDNVSAVCGFCAGAFGATKSVESAGLPLVREFEGHPSLRKLLTTGYQLLTF